MFLNYMSPMYDTTSNTAKIDPSSEVHVQVVDAFMRNIQFEMSVFSIVWVCILFGNVGKRGMNSGQKGLFSKFGVILVCQPLHE